MAGSLFLQHARKVNSLQIEEQWVSTIVEKKTNGIAWEKGNRNREREGERERERERANLHESCQPA